MVIAAILVALPASVLSLSARWTTSSGAAVMASAASRNVCTSSQLHTTVADGLAGAGHSSSVIVVRNAGPGSCRLTGYPDVRFLNGAGVEVARSVPTPQGFAGGLPVGAPIPDLDLRPGESASAVVEGTDIPIGTATSCPSYASYTITLPGWPGTTTIDHPYGGCSEIEVHPFVIGFNGTFPSGQVVGRAPTCATTGAAGVPGPFVQIEAWSGGHMVGMVMVFTSTMDKQRYRINLKPGRYRIRSAPAHSLPHEVVRAGRTVRLGTYRGCSRPTSSPSRGGLAGATTTTTT
jgi:Protein of unknown function (DUF4232)